MSETSLPTNRLAIISLCFALLTLFSFCIGFAPFLPLTAPICYPLALVFGFLAFVTGMMALRQLRSGAESGHGLAWTGAVLGGLTTFATICAITLTISAIAAFITQTLTQAKP